MGEAARHLSPVALKTLADLPWRQITGMRDILIHDYDDVDDATLWDTAQHDFLAGGSAVTDGAGDRTRPCRWREPGWCKPCH